jgi:hypothetical protein
MEGANCTESQRHVRLSRPNTRARHYIACIQYLARRSRWNLNSIHLMNRLFHRRCCAGRAPFTTYLTRTQPITQQLGPFQCQSTLGATACAIWPPRRCGASRHTPDLHKESFNLAALHKHQTHSTSNMGWQTITLYRGTRFQKSPFITILLW